MQHYPIILIPKSILDAKQPQKFEASYAGWYFLLMAGVATAMAETPIPFIRFIAICCFAIGIILMIVNKRNKSDYEEKIQIYQHNLHIDDAKHSQDQREKEQVIHKQKNKWEVKKFHDAQMKKILASTHTANIEYNNVTGRTEAFFLSVLRIHFGNYITTNKVIELFRSSRAYSPDFIFVDRDSNLHIDIEIDEPYVSSTGDPIHYLEDEDLRAVDSSRNAYFMEKGWCVIRFAEEQIIKYPTECCKVIAQVVSDISGNDFFIQQLAHVKDLPQVKHWTKKEAIKMCKRNVRNQY